MSDWWDRKLGRAGARPGATPRQSPIGPPTNGYDLYRARHPEVFDGFPVDQAQDAVPAILQQPQAPRMITDPRTGQQVPEGAFLNEAGQIVVPSTVAIRAWQGRDAAKEQERCPSCNSPRYFSRQQGIRRGPPPAPECFECGYPLVQSGSGMGGLAGASSAGGGKSKQLNVPAHLPTPMSERVIARVN